MKYTRTLCLLLILPAFSVWSALVSSAERSAPTPYELDYDVEALGIPNIPEDNPMTQEGVWLGRLLFYDPILSSTNEMSCGTCHIQSKSFTDGKKLAVGTYGDTLTRNTMSLVNLAWSEQFFWDGRQVSLEQLIREPLTSPIEMGQDTVELILELESHENYPALFSAAFPEEEISMENVSKAIAQFLRTIISNGFYLDSEALFKGEGQYEIETKGVIIDTEKSLRGSFVRFAKMCSNCHLGTIYGNEMFANNGVPSNSERMKVPALVNIYYSAPYMHDGRFASMGEVLKHYDEHLSELSSLNPELKFSSVNALTEYDFEHADEFFKLFEDTLVLTDPKTSNPFNDENFNWSGL